MASSIDLTFHSQNPATSSLVSANGPSTTALLPPEKVTRFPFELGCSPSPASITPAFTSSSLNLPMSAKSFSLPMTPDSDSLFALTMTMNRMCILLVRVGSGALDRTVRPRALLLLGRRTSADRIDTRTHFFVTLDNPSEPLGFYVHPLRGAMPGGCYLSRSTVA